MQFRILASSCFVLATYPDPRQQAIRGAVGVWLVTDTHASGSLMERFGVLVEANKVRVDASLRELRHNGIQRDD